MPRSWREQRQSWNPARGFSASTCLLVLSSAHLPTTPKTPAIAGEIGESGSDQSRGRTPAWAVECPVHTVSEPQSHPELVNLLLTGKASSNTFNDVVELDSGNGDVTLLKGIAARSDVGFLSLFEHYNVCQVGCFLKTPRFPIWVVCSESHFSVLFSLQPELLRDWRTERLFDLYYYDGLANQQEQIRLTVDTTQTVPEDGDSDLIPPLELCIRTKWKGASVNWNGSDPIL
ncbi:probable ubiquitin carboxyl-terminal hydrolase MINDY-4 [Pteropus vampyrus]|uniref:Ubiquitin carboxyl-terminal hydrolase MINDY n=1 Tax=Pteropus vampyrus TaxID=132908 RepID=A0A6P3Q8J0_PTEVA|nr:probable ubiquitin carboxyl-terminal hydrolase MINDY-4 [Pteropus vampyrus]